MVGGDGNTVGNARKDGKGDLIVEEPQKDGKKHL